MLGPDSLMTLEANIIISFTELTLSVLVPLRRRTLTSLSSFSRLVYVKINASEAPNATFRQAILGLAPITAVT